MVPVVQLVRMSDCGSEGHRFESGRAHQKLVGNYLRQMVADFSLAGIQFYGAGAEMTCLSYTGKHVLVFLQPMLNNPKRMG